MEILCDQCGKPFDKKCRTSRRRYCSKACKLTAYSESSNVITKCCIICSAEFKVKAYRASTARYCSVKCRAADHDHCTMVARKSGDTMRGRGSGKGYVKEGGRHQHRVVAERKLGRQLLPGEIVHHDDEVKSNNSPENLEVITQSNHVRRHISKMLSERKSKAGY